MNQPDLTVVAARPATIGFPNLLRSELTKLRSVRSTYWTALAAAVASVAAGGVICARIAAEMTAGQLGRSGFDGTLTSLNGLYLSQIMLGALGVLTISSEYGTGMIRATLAAVPQRRAMLAAKGLVFGLAVLAAGEAMSFAAFGLGQALLSGAHAGASLSQPGVLRAAAGGGLYLTVVGMLGFGLGALIRHTAGALTAFFGVLFLPSALTDLLPVGWHEAVQKFMPANAGTQIITVLHTPGTLGPWAGLGTLALYAAVILAVATVVTGLRDV
jgi:ABC-2 type transport system permease protein